MKRLRQIVTNIESRLFISEFRDNRLLSWQTRTLAIFISQTIEIEKGKENPLFEAAKKISLDQAELDDATAIPEPGTNSSEPAAGSFERLTRGFSGRPK